MTTSAPHLRENLLTPRFYTTEIEKVARTDLEPQRPTFEAMLAEMEADHNRGHFDRKAPLDRLRDLSPEEKTAYESYLVRSCVSEFSGFLVFKELSRRLFRADRTELGRLFQLMARDEALPVLRPRLIKPVLMLSRSRLIHGLSGSPSLIPMPLPWSTWSWCRYGAATL